MRSRFAAAAIDYMILTVCFFVSAVAVRALGFDVSMLTIRFSLATVYFTLTEWLRRRLGWQAVAWPACTRG